MARPAEAIEIGREERASRPLNGAWRLSFNFGWGAVRQESRIMQNVGPHTMPDGPQRISYDDVIWSLPLNKMPQHVSRNAQFYKDWLAHPDYDEY